MIGGLTGTGRPTSQITLAMAKAKKMFMAGPARATQILETGEAGGTAESAAPSMVSEVSI